MINDREDCILTTRNKFKVEVFEWWNELADKRQICSKEMDINIDP